MPCLVLPSIDGLGAMKVVKFKHSLSRRLLKIVLSIYFVITFVTTALHIFLEYSSAMDDVRGELVVTERAFENSLASSLWILDIYQLEITANGITELPLVTGIEVRDEDGTIILQLGELNFEQEEYDEGIFWHQFPVSIIFDGQQRRVGEVRLFSSKEIVFNRIKLGVKILLINAIVKSVALMLLITIVFNRLLTKPLELLAFDAKSIDLNNLKEKRIVVACKEENELKILEFSINNMIDKLAVSVADLDTLNKNLEEKVVDRTNSLNHVIQQLEKDQAALKREVSIRLKREKQLVEGQSALQKSLKELSQAQDQLIESEKMASLGSLVAGVAHEINTPIGISLTGITHFQYMLKTLEKKYNDGDLEEKEFERYLKDAVEISQSIHISLDRAAKLVSSFKRVAVDQTHEVTRCFKVREYVNEVLLSLQNKIKLSAVRVEVDCDEAIEINSYPGAWSQIITNFITNSLIHAYKKNHEGCIKLAFRLRSESLIFVFSDDGVGMDKAVESKIFDPFYTTNREDGGTGLGLNIVYNLVTQQMKGSIEVESRPYLGTTFTIIIPSEVEV